MSPSRRQVLRTSGASAAALVTAGIAGCSSQSGSNTTDEDGQPDETTEPEDAGSTAELSMVPKGVSMVARGNVTRTLQDSAVRQFVDMGLKPLAQRESYSGPTSRSEVVSLLTEQLGLDVTKAETAVAFAKYQSQYAGFWIRASWSKRQVFDQWGKLYSYGEFKETTYNGRPLYTPTEKSYLMSIGVPEPNTYVIGRETAVKDTIDVVNGETEGLGAELRNAYTNVRAAPFRFAVRIPDWVSEESIDIGGQSIDLEAFEPVEHLAGATYHEADTAGIVLTLLVSSGSDAGAVKETVDALVTTAASVTEDQTLSRALEDVTVTSDGSIVRVEATGSVDRAARVIKSMVEQVYGVA